MAEVPAPETSWESSPGIIDGAMSLQLTAQGCDLDYWIRAVAQGTLARLVHGHRATAGVPEFMKRPGPLREALIHEMAFRSMAEEKATRAIADLVRIAPGLAEMEFYVTQLFDEAGHARVFRGHIVELGVPPEELTELIEGVRRADPRVGRLYRRRRDADRTGRRRAGARRGDERTKVASARPRRRRTDIELGIDTTDSPPLRDARAAGSPDTARRLLCGCITAACAAGFLVTGPGCRP